jgi:hypothetical protein
MLNGPEGALVVDVDAGVAESGCGNAVDGVRGIEGPHVEVGEDDQTGSGRIGGCLVAR